MANSKDVSLSIVTKFPAYPPASHALHQDLLELATKGRILFGTDMPNVAIALPEQIQAVFHTFAGKDWKAPLTDRWWTRKEEARRAGPAVEQVLFAAANKLLAEVDVSKVDKGNSSKM